MDKWSRRDFIKLRAQRRPAARYFRCCRAARSRRTGRPTQAADAAAKAHLGVFGEPDTGENYFTALVHFQDQISRAGGHLPDVPELGTADPQRHDHRDPRPQPEPVQPPTLYISFHAFLDSKGSNCLAWADIANGVYDADIDAWSDELLQIGKPAYIVLQPRDGERGGRPPDRVRVTRRTSSPRTGTSAAGWRS